MSTQDLDIEVGAISFWERAYRAALLHIDAFQGELEAWPEGPGMWVKLTVGDWSSEDYIGPASELVASRAPYKRAAIMRLVRRHLETL